jgi:subtilisin family serine protease
MNRSLLRKLVLILSLVLVVGFVVSAALVTRRASMPGTSLLPTALVLPDVSPVPTVVALALPPLQVASVPNQPANNRVQPAAATDISPTESVPLVSAAQVAQSLTVASPSPTDLPTQAATVPVAQSAPPVAAVPNQVIIRFASDASEAERAEYIASIGGEVDSEISALDAVVVSLTSDATPDADTSSLIVASEPDYFVSALADEPPSDPLYGDQWGLPAIGAPAAWASLSADLPSVTVAVIDSGICASHPDLQGRITRGWDFVDNDATPDDLMGHGCGVAGIIAANANNGEGIAGVAPNARIMPLRVLDAQGLGTYSNVAAAIVYAVDNGAEIINLSLGGANASDLLADAIGYAATRGVTVVAASGNTGREGVLYPAAYSSVIAVGAVNRSLERAIFSTYGPQVDLMAPGQDVYTTTLTGYARANGTSFAAPHVAGVAALEKAAGRALAVTGNVVHAGPVEVAALPTVLLTETVTVTPTLATALPTGEAPARDPQLVDRLMNQVQALGETRLIVGVRTGGGSGAQGQQVSVQMAQDNLIGQLSSFDVEVLADYDVIPYLALRTDAVGLAYLLASPDVLTIEEDIAVPPALDVSTARIGATTTWAMNYGGAQRGAGQAVAVLDTGVYSSHSFLTGKVVSEACYSTNNLLTSESSLCPGGATSSTATGSAVPPSACNVSSCSHGTHVAGIAAGRGSTFNGVAPDASIIAIQIFTLVNNSVTCGGTAPCVLSYTSDQLSGLERVYALRSQYSIASINMSLGGGLYTGYCDSGSTSRKAIIDQLRAAGIATVIASGNNGSSNSISAPACISSAISVGAVNDSDVVASFSNSASILRLLAPGVNINSSILGGFASWSGTSMATPHVAGAFALLKAIYPTESVDQLLARLENNGVPVRDTRNGITRPRIQIDAAVLNAPNSGSPTPTTTVTATATQTPTATATSSAGASGNGLVGSYYNGVNFNTLRNTKTDPTIDFNWGTGAPSNVNTDNFSVRWEGFIRPQYSQLYTFFLYSDDGSRVYINNQLVVNHWSDHGASEKSGTIQLTAGVNYAIRVEYYDRSSSAVMRLSWSSPSQTKQVVPQARLFTTNVGGIQPTPTNTPTATLTATITRTPTPSLTPTVSTTGDGLVGSYYNGVNFNTLRNTKTDRTIDFNWGSGAPSNVNRDNFSVRWEGFIRPQYSQLYTFFLYSDDGSRLYINDQLVVNHWSDHGASEKSGTIQLTAGVNYAIRVEYYERSSGAVMRLSWSSPSQSKQVVPQARLFTTNAGGAALGFDVIFATNTPQPSNEPATATLWPSPSATMTASSLPPTTAPSTTPLPSLTPVPPTATTIPPTLEPPTATALPPTATLIPPSATTPPTATLEPPTATDAPPAEAPAETNSGSEATEAA